MNNNGVHFMMPTVFNDSGKIDLESMMNITKFAKDSGCAGIVLLGVMGEAHRLSEEERNFGTEISEIGCIFILTEALFFIFTEHELINF